MSTLIDRAVMVRIAQRVLSNRLRGLTDGELEDAHGRAARHNESESVVLCAAIRAEMDRRATRDPMADARSAATNAHLASLARRADARTGRAGSTPATGHHQR